jgi:phosphoglycerate kinase
MVNNFKSVRDLDLQGKKVVVRVDFNVPLSNGLIDDETRIVGALPTIVHILQEGGSVVLISHLGRPKGNGFEAEFSLKPVAERLKVLLAPHKVLFANDCIGPEVERLSESLKPSEVLLLENVRFHKEEEVSLKLSSDVSEEMASQLKIEAKQKQKDFAQQLASLGNVYVNDAFGAAHRSHASTAIMAKFFKEKAAGFLMEKELTSLGKALTHPERPFVAILGGAKVSDKVKVIENLISKVDTLLIGGAMAYTFLKAQGTPVGKSLVEDDKLTLARDLFYLANEKKVTLLTPIDHVVAKEFSATSSYEIVGEDDVPKDMMALDIGPMTQKLFVNEICKAKTVVWNGPMGCFEMQPFAGGTFAVAKAIAETHCFSVVGGGDSVSAINKSGLAPSISHVSTGGGASLEFLEGKALPGVVCLSQ